MMTTSAPPFRGTTRPWRRWARWTAGATVFPLAGLAGIGAAGAVDSPGAALAAGAATGLVLGGGQVLASGRDLRTATWVVATAAGMTAGLALGATAVGFRTGLADLAAQGALTGVVLGLAQAVALPRSAGRRRWAWAAAMPALWALGWTATTLVGVDVAARYPVFGAVGALAVSALSAPLLTAVVRDSPPR